MKKLSVAKEKIEKETGKKIVRLVAVFEVEVNTDVEDSKVWSKYTTKLTKEFSTLKSLEIE